MKRNYRNYRSYKPRSIRKTESKSKKKLIWSIIISLVLLFVLINWVLPALAGGLSLLNKVNSQNLDNKISDEIMLAPPVLNIPYEATNTAGIRIRGYATPNTKVKIYLDDIEGSTAVSGNEGEFISDEIELSIGINNIYGKTLDEKESESLPSKTIQVLYDNEKPKLEISEPLNNHEIKGGDKKVTISGITDPENEILINGFKVILNMEGKFSSQINLNDGDNNVIVTATNGVGNSTTQELKIKYTPN